MNPLRKHQNEDKKEMSSFDDKMYPLVQSLFFTADLETFKKDIMEGHICNLRQTVETFDCNGSEISNLASLNWALINFLEKVHGLYQESRKMAKMEPIAFR
ncbi:hypothetical protein [Maribacter aurantiacus]|uniref:Uncharacterized protein n=1 Tax=Maribacter aurantiacus TaxID=1882343 RepID=A0A5R8MBI9_9FLAO|nr:hypothetical protein [Maribacter aurantiacus]TLF46928.1 hypothetical protein FEK29_03925 [Maribacter aurantiacus]